MTPDTSSAFSAGLLPTIRMLMGANGLEDVRAAIAHGTRLMSRYRTLSLHERGKSDDLEVTFRDGVELSGGVEVEELLRATVAKTGRAASTLDRFAGEKEQSLVDEYVSRYGLCLALPLAPDGSLLGVLALQYEGRVALADAEFAALKRFIDFAAVALVNAGTRDELMSYAHTDPLTSLGNRRSLDVELTRLRDTRLALLLIDFDDLKAVNDTLGYERGDALIKSIGIRLAATARPDEILVRLGGDEFVAILPDADKARAVARAEEMTAALDGIDLGEELQRLFHGASVGWATAEPGEDSWQVLNRAAQEMRSRKRRRKSDLGQSGAQSSNGDSGAAARALDVWRSREEV